MNKDIKKEQWYKDPFGWYVSHGKPEVYGVQMTPKVALDFLQGLYDIYESLKKHDKEHAMRETEILATLLIASAFDVGHEVIEELLIEEFEEIDVDEAFAKLVEEENK